MIKQIVLRHLLPKDDFIYGFADLSGLVSKKFAGFNHGISIGKRLDSLIVNEVITGPTKEYLEHYKQVNNDLASLTEKISKDLNDNNIEAINIEPTVSTRDLDTIYYKTLRTDLSHKMVATRAGLGWIGKTDLFISKQFGPRLRLVSILIKTPVKPETKPIDKSHCGTCNVCVEICPAQAANGKQWNITVEREEFFDAWKCRNQCAEFGLLKLGSNSRVCGICVATCPLGRPKV